MTYTPLTSVVADLGNSAVIAVGVADTLTPCTGWPWSSVTCPVIEAPVDNDASISATVAPADTITGTADE